MEIKGELFGWSETGTEGTVWVLQDENYINKETGYYDYKGLNPIQNGDTLTIFEKADPTKVLWEGEIYLAGGSFWIKLFGKKSIVFDKERKLKVGYMKYPQNPKYGQLNFGGWWIHNVPMGLKLDLKLWYNVFLENSHTYKGKIIREENKK